MTSPATTGLGAVNFDTAFVKTLTPHRDDFDQLGHVNNTVYVRWVQEMATAHWAAIAPAVMQAAYLFIVLRHEIDYRDPILPGDAVEARTWLGAAKGPRFERFVDIRKPGAQKPSAAATTVWCMLDARTMRPKRVGADILEAFQVPG
ncbi:MAG: thioesterase family protein [Pseudomonadota bacterium]